MTMLGWRAHNTMCKNCLYVNSKENIVHLSTSATGCGTFSYDELQTLGKTKMLLIKTKEDGGGGGGFERCVFVSRTEFVNLLPMIESMALSRQMLAEDPKYKEVVTALQTALKSNRTIDDHNKDGGAAGGGFQFESGLIMIRREQDAKKMRRQNGPDHYAHDNAWVSLFDTSTMNCLYVGKDNLVHLSVWATGARLTTIENDELETKKMIRRSMPRGNLFERIVLLSLEQFMLL